MHAEVMRSSPVSPPLRNLACLSLPIFGCGFVLLARFDLVAFCGSG